MPFDIHNDNNELQWSGFNYLIYLKTHKGKDLQEVSAKINAHLDEIFLKNDKTYKAEEINLYAQPYGDTYLYSSFELMDVPAGGRIQYVMIFATVAIFILVIACINFMNMATAHAANRGKEVGVRKVSGAVRSGLVFQFIAESVIISFVSTTRCAIPRAPAPSVLQYTRIKGDYCSIQQSGVPWITGIDHSLHRNTRG